MSLEEVGRTKGGAPSQSQSAGVRAGLPDGSSTTHRGRQVHTACLPKQRPTVMRHPLSPPAVSARTQCLGPLGRGYRLATSALPGRRHPALGLAHVDVHHPGGAAPHLAGRTRGVQVSRLKWGGLRAAGGARDRHSVACHLRSRTRMKDLPSSTMLRRGASLDLRVKGFRWCT